MPCDRTANGILPVMHVVVFAYDMRNYRVAQNKPDYLLLSSKFCISTTKHVSMIM